MLGHGPLNSQVRQIIPPDPRKGDPQTLLFFPPPSVTNVMNLSQQWTSGARHRPRDRAERAASENVDQQV